MYKLMASQPKRPAFPFDFRREIRLPSESGAKHASQDGTPSPKDECGAMNVACDLVGDPERILEAHPGLP